MTDGPPRRRSADFGSAAFVFRPLRSCSARTYLPESVPAWLVVAGWFVLAGGALLTYVGLGFQQATYLDVSRTTALFGNIVFGLGAVGLLILAARRSWSPADPLGG